MYPALAVALVSAMPGWIVAFEAFYVNKSAEQYLYEQQQSKFWADNGQCLSDTYDPNDFANDIGNVMALLCPSKDIAVVYIDAETNKPVYSGVKIQFLRNKLPFKEASHSTVFGMTAFAAENPLPQIQLARTLKLEAGAFEVAQSAVVVCQVMQADGHTLLRHINNGAGECYDEYLDTFTGIVANIIQVPCRQTCEG